ncbi:PLP-dependent aminotransferase family protein [Deinococcus humi]|uniref:DNA-binding transcriptional MocR family regulator n=1 Tax=Deinococcus humi TaxID=662880 RepID=A0A7W8JUW2_9DEIO|nr:PLP-dependent aminotransferase family protein [Deinococcus humi]MBB5363385.1 DNA-binding transcriptional MocR family regulator [Deinococcus humi]GGO26779.1 DNA-binding transcriptional regulator [Deinococcus humi]
MDAPRWSALLFGWRAGSGPLRDRLAESVRAGIRSGQLPPSEALPAERALAGLLDVSRSTVVAAYDTLADEGWITRRRGSGTRVATTAPRGANVLDLRTPSVLPRDEDSFDFTIAVPLLNDAQRQELREATLDAFQESLYHPHGLPELRALLAEIYTREGLPTTPEMVLITSGAQGAISLLAGVFLRPRDRALLETPTYFGAIDAFRAAGAETVGVPVTAEGVGPAAFAGAVQQYSPRLAFLTPTFQNPTGTIMPVKAREQVAAAVADADLPTLEDDTLIDLGFEVTPPPRMATFAPDAPIFNIGSLSKLYWAGLRVGWLRVPAAHAGPVGQARTLSDFGSSLPGQHIAMSLLQDLPRLRQERREAVTAARDLLAELLCLHLPEWRFTVPGGGQFLWVELPTRQTSAFTLCAARYGMRLFPGASMSVTMNTAGLPDSFLRLPFTLEPARLPEAVLRLKAAWTEFTSRQGADRLA